MHNPRRFPMSKSEPWWGENNSPLDLPGEEWVLKYKTFLSSESLSPSLPEISYPWPGDQVKALLKQMPCSGLLSLVASKSITRVSSWYVLNDKVRALLLGEKRSNTTSQIQTLLICQPEPGIHGTSGFLAVLDWLCVCNRRLNMTEFIDTNSLIIEELTF